MDFSPPLIPATLLRRYKRFLADCTLADGTEVTAHCANPGSMMGLAEPGSRIWLEPNDDPKKKLKYGWRLVEHGDGHFTGVDTALPNRMLKAALTERRIPEVAAYPDLQAEVRYGEKSRVDFRLSGDGLPPLWLEVKSVTLSRVAGVAEFPDSVTQRGARHMADLAAMARQGDRAVIFYLVQRTDAQEVRLAADIDPTYAQAVSDAVAAGVEVIAYDTRLSPQSVALGRRLPVIL
ncbi:DNA/RNA nuclease SfsA [uncultured Maritimibacter sp.]|jgi:sugar fermentation stimulation protein A|uniref:DNA/RNA nuclease SfsA n=1 Tax=uncultured Maritimibacter sp. TaxID=991866 RepID=UPI0026349EF1|nr:DNA/RNA nuclease SfsA [uncultured Maritimibacter sp.]